MDLGSTPSLFNSSNTILMVRPANFGSNPETLADNAFQQDPHTAKLNGQEPTHLSEKIKNLGKQQFDNYVKVLRQEGIDVVVVVEDNNNPVKPDAVFPNNWFTTHLDNTLIQYPMKPASRRPERTIPVIQTLSNSYVIQKSYNFADYQQKQIFLQGTGSMVFDHQNKIAYACISERTHEQLFFKVCKEVLGYQPIFFQARSSQGKRYYHTNVVMAVASDFVIVGLEQIDSNDREIVKNKILASNGSVQINGVRQKKQLIELTEEQINNFCGNVLEVTNKEGNKILTMSETAFNSFRKDQLEIIKRYCKIVKVALPSIQSYGGGGSRCMMAEIFLAKKKITE